MNVFSTKLHILLFLSMVVLASCQTTSPLIDDEFNPSAANMDSIVANIPDYSGSLVAVEGSGRAIVSEPGNSDRVNISFIADTSFTYMNFKNRIGIEGGEMLVDKDSILIYNKVDKVAQKISGSDGRLTSLNELASVNLLDLFNFKIQLADIRRLFESDSQYLLQYKNRGTAVIDKITSTVIRVNQPFSAGLPYSEITYDNYGEIEGYILPRKITIFSADGNSKVIFQVRSLSVNPDNITISLNIPEDIYIERL